jgi:hypothetical protein
VLLTIDDVSNFSPQRMLWVPSDDGDFVRDVIKGINDEIDQWTRLDQCE